jgi:hypothetical protein
MLRLGVNLGCPESAPAITGELENGLGGEVSGHAQRP